MTHFLKKAAMTQIWLITYTIYTSYDCKFYFWFSDAKIFEIRPRKIFKTVFSLECVGGIKIWLQIQIQRKISHRMICIDMGSMFILYHFSRNIAFHAYAIIIFKGIVGKINMDPISMHIIRREILRWIRIWSQNLIPPTHSWEKTISKILRRRISKIFA